MIICPQCFREHTGACDTRTIEQRVLDSRIAQLAAIIKERSNDA